MKYSVKLLLVGAVMALSLGASSSQAATLDVVHDSNGTPVITKDNDCVRSNWESDTDNCKMQETAEVPAAPIMMTRNMPVYFAFGQSALTPAGKKALDATIADIKALGHNVKAIRIAGYADHIGSATANEKLSKKRADVVRQYLVSKGVVNAQVVETRWFGDSAPATNCPKKLSKAKMIKCLQGDRRVDIEVITPLVQEPVPAE